VPATAETLNPSYVARREDLLSLVQGAPKRVLDVGCSVGSNGAWLKLQHDSWVTGIEIDPNAAELARAHLDEVLEADLNRSSLAELLPGRRFDLVLLGDVLEHLIDPWRALADVRAMLSPAGRVVTSLPNIAHYSTIVDLALFRRWAYRDRGIHDRTHLRFFTRKNLAELYAGAGFAVEQETRNMRLVERVSRVNRLAPLFDFPPLRPYLTFQYVHVLRPL
jgi:2-polyprenyl-3-methyl-5-hydroxy-6-metoxy-1,4-benzoquinol methylase